MHEISVLSWDRGGTAAVQPEAMETVLEAARRSCDLVVVDLPRGLDPATRVVLDLASVALLVVPAEVRAAAAAARVAASLGLLCRDLRVVVRGPAPGGLAAADVSRALGVPLAGSVRAEPGLDLALERGKPPATSGRGPLAELCAQLIEQVLPSVGQAA